MSDDAVEVQREVARIALARIGQFGFALAGSGAIREHGLTDRPTEDIDLFTVSQHIEQFERAVTQVIDDLKEHGYDVEEIRRTPQFARLRVRLAGDARLDVDLGVDWREERPVIMGVGPVLSLKDAVGNKVSALYSRGEPRDYVDVDAIRGAGRFTDEELLGAAADRDAGFVLGMFAQQLDAARRISLRDIEPYGVTAEELQAIKDRCSEWADRLRAAE